jgi:hypothetical protein
LEGEKVRRWKAKRDHSTMGLSDYGTKVRCESAKVRRCEGARPDRSPPFPPAAGEKRQGTAALQDASRPSSALGQRASVPDCAKPRALSVRGWRRAAEKQKGKE